MKKGCSEGLIIMSSGQLLCKIQSSGFGNESLQAIHMKGMAFIGKDLGFLDCLEIIVLN